MQVARQEAELLARLDGRPREHDATDLLGEQARDRLRHREVGLARAGRTDAEDDVVLLDGFEILALRRRLGHDLALGRGAHAALEEVIAEVEFRMLGHQLHGVLHLAAGEAVAVAQKRAELADERLHAIEAFAGPVHDELVPAGADTDAEQIFEQAQVVVVGAEQDVDALIRNGNGTRGRGSDTGDLLCRQLSRPRLTCGWTLACRLRSGKRLEVQFFHLPRIDRRWRIGHQVDRGGGLRERNDVANRRLAGQQRDDAIEPERDAAMRRRAELERVDEEAETQLRLLVGDAEQAEELPLDLRDRGYGCCRRRSRCR